MTCVYSVCVSWVINNLKIYEQHGEKYRASAEPQTFRGFRNYSSSVLGSWGEKEQLTIQSNEIISYLLGGIVML